MARDEARDDAHQLDHWIRAHIREWRERRGMSQARLAELMQLNGHRWHQATVYKIEAGERTVTAAELMTLSLVLEVPVEQLGMFGSSVEVLSLEDAQKGYTDAQAELEAARVEEREMEEESDRVRRRYSEAVHRVRRARRRFNAAEAVLEASRREADDV